MIEAMDDFLSRVDASFRLDQDLIVKKQNRYFLLNKNLKKLISKDFFYAGIYLGKTEDRKFLPSFSLLGMIAEGKVNKVIVDKKTAWLFICGRDVFKQGILRVLGSERKGDYTLVLNMHGECLGFGRILCDLGTKRKGVAVKNISDIGDFLRRER